MNVTSIDWADMTWNPVTGCLHGCPYCYAAQVARRFGGNNYKRTIPGWYTADGLPVLDGQMTRTQKNGKEAAAPFPFYFEPTFHRYRLGDPAKTELPRNIFVCSMADLFGRWVPTDWIAEVLDACLAAPQHNYLFLTKNPKRYMELDHLALLPRKGNFWYGSTVTTDSDAFFWSEEHNTFLSVEPMHGPMNATGRIAANWIIVGAETGRRPGKVTPRREWVMDLAEECREAGVPIYMKQNLVTEGVLERGELVRQRPAGMTFA